MNTENYGHRAAMEHAHNGLTTQLLDRSWNNNACEFPQHRAYFQMDKRSAGYRVRLSSIARTMRF